MLHLPTYLEKSPINGIGLFAKETILVGTLVWEFTLAFDTEIAPEAFAALPLGAREYLLHYGNLTESSGTSPSKAVYLLCGDNARFMNHSNTPNVSSGTDRNCALRDILAGEELTCDYREFDLTFTGFK